MIHQKQLTSFEKRENLITVFYLSTNINLTKFISCDQWIMDQKDLRGETWKLCNFKVVILKDSVSKIPLLLDILKSNFCHN